MKNLKNRREKLIYLGAMLDGEGSIGIERLSPCKVKRKGKEEWQRKKYYYTCRVCVVNTFLPMLEFFKKEFGGSINYKNASTNKQCYRWHIFGENLESLLYEVLPFLWEKKPHAKILLDYRKTVGKTGWNLTNEILEKRNQLWLKCKNLNKNGVPLKSSPLSPST